MNSQISVRLVVLFYAFLYVSRRKEGYEVTFIGQFAWEWVFLSTTLGRFFSHREHGGHGGFKRTVSSTQKASGIQSSQSVTAKKGCWVIVVMC